MNPVVKCEFHISGAWKKDLNRADEFFDGAVHAARQTRSSRSAGHRTEPARAAGEYRLLLPSRNSPLFDDVPNFLSAWSRPSRHRSAQLSSGTCCASFSVQQHSIGSRSKHHNAIAIRRVDFTPSESPRYETDDRKHNVQNIEFPSHCFAYPELSRKAKNSIVAFCDCARFQIAGYDIDSRRVVRNGG